MEKLYKKVYKWRVFPRLFSFIYIALMCYIVVWACGLNDLSATQASFAAAVFGAGAAWFKFFVQSGPGTKNDTTL